MTLQPPPRLSSVLACVLAAALVLAVASCRHITPLGPGAVPQPHHLKSPFVLQAMRMQPPASIDGCPPGYTLFPEPDNNPGLCARPGRHAGNDHLRSGLLCLFIPAEASAGPAGRTRRVPIHHHPARR